MWSIAGDSWTSAILFKQGKICFCTQGTDDKWQPTSPALWPPREQSTDLRGGCRLRLCRLVWSGGGLPVWQQVQTPRAAAARWPARTGSAGSNPRVTRAANIDNPTEFIKIKPTLLKLKNWIPCLILCSRKINLLRYIRFYISVN